MNRAGWSIADDIGTPAGFIVAALLVVGLVLLITEVFGRERGRALVFGTGLLGMLLFAAAVLRPARVTVRGMKVGPRVVVLVDQSRRLLIPTDGGGTRRDRALEVARGLAKSLEGARVSVLGFGEGSATPLPLGEGDSHAGRLTTESDLRAALASLSGGAVEHPEAVVVVSDGRLSTPTPDGVTKDVVGRLGVPVHTVEVERREPPDASIRSVRAAGAAVAHQSLALTVEVGCSGGLSCKMVPVTVTELRSGVEPALLASGEAKVEDGVGKVELDVTLDRAGERVIEVAIEPPTGDALQENDSRLLTLSVARDRVRLLHLAGRPTYDVRALRRWLKSDEAVDVVAFFILREAEQGANDPNAEERELALIEFPVNELFTTHLPSFDAVILQDIDAVKYKLAQHLPRLARYVETGGGLIMVGGPSSFGGGKYSQTPLDGVLPVEQPVGGEDVDMGSFVPDYTEAARAAPVMRGLRDLVGEELPAMHGTNLLGPPRPGSIVLLEHPRLMAGKSHMPVLALGEAGDGRSIALSIDDTHQLAFSQFAAKVAGRAYGSLWDGLLGWLMRDPRYEAARVDLPDGCIAGESVVMRVTRLPGMEGKVDVEIERLGLPSGDPIRAAATDAGQKTTVDVELPKLQAGGYTARVRIGAAPPTRYDFACERAGPAWADSRPDPERLARIAKVTGGKAVTYKDADSISVPSATEVAAERHVSPLLPPWAWSLASTVMLGVHWVARRRSGLS